jgi:4-amino-4-deoxy-L-arabinose transferase-like glycosyltransferase
LSSKRRRAAKRRSPRPASQQQQQQTRTASAAVPVAEAPPRRAPRPRDEHRKTAAAPAPVSGEASLGRVPVLAAAATGLIAFIVYLVTIEPSVPTGDSGELITAAKVLGVAHPPGYPLYTMLGHFATMISFGHAALGMNILSALLDAATVGIVFVTIYRLVGVASEGRGTDRRVWMPLVAPAVGALLLAFSTEFWTYSVVAEVFALNNLFAALLLLLALEWARHPERRKLLWAFGLILGLALSNQQTIVLLGPAFLVLAWSGVQTLRRHRRRGRAEGTRRLRVADVAIAAGLFVLGLLPYVYLPLAARSNPLVDWGNPNTFARFTNHIFRKDYGTLRLSAGGKTGSIGQNLGLIASNLTTGFVFVGIVLAAVGLWWGWRNRRTAAVALALAFLFAGPIFVAYAKTAFPDELSKGVVARFYILPSIPLAILVGMGAWLVLVWAQRLRRPALRPIVVVAIVAGALLVVPVASAVVHFNDENHSGDWVDLHYAQDVLSPLAPNALLLMSGDENGTSMDYAQGVEHLRPDVVALDAQLLTYPTYVDQMRRQHPSIVIPFENYTEGKTNSLNDLVQANIDQRPVYSVGVVKEKKFGKGFDREWAGFAQRLLPLGTAPNQYADLRARAQRFAALRYPTRKYRASSWEETIAQDYGRLAINLGYALQTEHDPKVAPLAERMLRTAIRLMPDDKSAAPAYKNLGLLLFDENADPKQIVGLWNHFLRLDPSDPQAPAIRTQIAKLQARKGQ